MKNLLKGQATCQLRTGVQGCAEIIQTIENGGEAQVWLVGINNRIMVYTDEDKTNGVGPLKCFAPNTMVGKELNDALAEDEIYQLITDNARQYRCFVNSRTSNGLYIINVEESEKEKILEIKSSGEETVDFDYETEECIEEPTGIHQRKLPTSYGECIKQCQVKGKELLKRIAYLRLHGVTPEDTPVIFMQTLDKMMPLTVNTIQIPKRLYEHHGTGESLILRILRNITLGESVILEGQKSVGKNVAWESISWLLNRPIEMNTYGAKTTKGDIIGVLGTDNTPRNFLTTENAKAFLFDIHKGTVSDESAGFLTDLASSMSPKVTLQEGALTRAIMTAEEKGTIYIADEWNLGQPSLNSQIFNTLLDGHSKEYDIPLYGSTKLSRNMIIGGTMNTLGFIGTLKQNSATMSRTNVIVIDALSDIRQLLDSYKFVGEIQSLYISEIEEPETSGIEFSEEDLAAGKVGTLNLEKANALVKELNVIKGNVAEVYKTFENAVQMKSVSDDAINFRGFQRAIKHILLGQSTKEAIKECVINACQDVLERQTLEMEMSSILAD